MSNSIRIDGANSASIVLHHARSINQPSAEHRAFVNFLQMMSNRKQVGFLRYGSINQRQLYLTRMKRELVAYKKTGNMEQLLNIATYCFLESIAPEHPDFHFDATVESVTRK